MEQENKKLDTILTNSNLSIFQKNEIRTLFKKDKLMIEFARHCMTELLSKKESEESISEISALDIDKIEKILIKYK